MKWYIRGNRAPRVVPKTQRRDFFWLDRSGRSGKESQMAGAKARIERQRKRKAGGKVKNDNIYNAKGAPEEKEEKDRKDGFKAGGRKRKDGGEVGGKKARHRLDKRSRDGHSPLSSANRVGSTERGSRPRSHKQSVAIGRHFADGGDIGPNPNAEAQYGITQGDEPLPSETPSQFSRRAFREQSGITPGDETPSQFSRRAFREQYQGDETPREFARRAAKRP